MANYVGNIVRMDNIEQLPIFSKAKDGDFILDFNKIISVPEQYMLDTTKSPDLNWCRMNWGTITERPCVEISKNSISFATAWREPDLIIKHLSKVYSSVVGFWWADEDLGSNFGYRLYQDGQMLYEDLFDDTAILVYWGFYKCPNCGEYANTSCLCRNIKL